MEINTNGLWVEGKGCQIKPKILSDTWASFIILKACPRGDVAFRKMRDLRHSWMQGATWSQTPPKWNCHQHWQLNCSASAFLWAWVNVNCKPLNFPSSIASLWWKQQVNPPGMTGACGVGPLPGFLGLSGLSLYLRDDHDWNWSQVDLGLRISKKSQGDLNVQISFGITAAYSKKGIRR
jgi:hypothetical protein